MSTATNKDRPRVYHLAFKRMFNRCSVFQAVVAAMDDQSIMIDANHLLLPCLQVILVMRSLVVVVCLNFRPWWRLPIRTFGVAPD